MEKLEKKQNTEVLINDLYAGSNDGFENLSNDMLSPARLKIAQLQSDQVQKESDNYIEGLEAGDMYITSTEKNIGKSVKVVPIAFYEIYTEWEGSAANGSFVRNILPQDYSKRVKKGEVNNDGLTPNGTRIAYSINFLVFLPENKDQGLVIFTLQGTGLTHARRWITKANAQRRPGHNTKLPLFAGVWEVSTVLNQNDKGRWYQIGTSKTTKVNLVGTLDQEYPALVQDVISIRDIAKEYVQKADRIIADTEENTEEKIPF